MCMKSKPKADRTTVKPPDMQLPGYPSFYKDIQGLTVVKADLLQIGEVKKQLRFVVLTESALFIFDETEMGPEKKVIATANLKVKSFSDTVIHIAQNETLLALVMRSKTHRNEWIEALSPEVKKEQDSDFKLTQLNEENVEIEKEVTVKTQVAAVKTRSLEQVELNAQLRSERIAVTSLLMKKVQDD